VVINANNANIKLLLPQCIICRFVISWPQRLRPQLIEYDKMCVGESKIPGSEGVSLQADGHV